jgi:hypothetical protein
MKQMQKTNDFFSKCDQLETRSSKSGLNNIFKKMMQSWFLCFGENFILKNKLGKMGSQVKKW